MKKILSCLLVLFSVTTFAADTPTIEVSTPTDYVGEARKAIKTKDWGAAQAALKLAIRDEPRNADAHNLLAYSYRKQAKPDLPKAFEHYHTALNINPNHRGAHEYIGEAFLMDKKPEEAEKHLAALEKICGNKSCEEYVDLQRSIEQYRATQK
ncbi:MAG: enzyme of heme biosynthesis [Burkholderiales bacterium PBB4]|nr:MAG: enzyme of heme biosynthesis [Burkholderiales bacterium PBB4]